MKLKSIASNNIGLRRAALIFAVAASLCAAFALVACGGNSAQSASSASSASGSSASSASSSAASSSAASSAASQSSAGKPSEAYVPQKIDIKTNDGGTLAITYGFDDNGRMLSNNYNLSLPGEVSITDLTYTEWDEHGHATKAEGTCDIGDGKPFPVTTEASVTENEDGTAASVTEVSTFKKESFNEGDAASQKTTQTMEYSDDRQYCKKHETKIEFFDASNSLMATSLKTQEFDTDGLQTLYTYEAALADGSTFNMTATITWTKDASGKPTSFQINLKEGNGPESKYTGDVEVDESGLVSRVSNIVLDGNARTTTASIDRVKISNPLPNAYEGWKSFAISDVLFIQ